MLYVPCLSIFWKNKHSHPNLPASLYPYLPLSCQDRQSKGKEQRQKRLNSTHLGEKKENKEIKTNIQLAKYETSYIWADNKYGQNTQLEKWLTHPLTPFYVGYVLISSLKSEFLEPSRMKNYQSKAFGTQESQLGAV